MGLYYETISENEEDACTSDIAWDYGWTCNRMLNWLVGRKILYISDDRWTLHPDYIGLGYTHESDSALLWTQKGRMFLYELLKEHGILPLIELNCDNKEKIKMNEKKTKFPLPVEAFGSLTRDELETVLRSEHKVMSETYINYKRKLSEAFDEDGRVQARAAMNASKWSLDYCTLRAIEEDIVLEEIPVRNSVGDIIKVIRYPCDTSVSDMVLPTEADLMR